MTLEVVEPIFLLQDNDEMLTQIGGRFLLQEARASFGTINVGTGGIGTAIINTNYPVVDGIIGGTTSQTRHISNLVPERSFLDNFDRARQDE